VKILIVDDDAMSRNAVTSFLAEDLGHETVQCASAEEALQHCRAEPFPLVVTDMRMQGMSGLGLLRAVRALPGRESTEVVIMTGFGDMESAIAALRAGAVDYLLKPLNIEELALVVDRIVQRRRVEPPVPTATPPATDESVNETDTLLGGETYMDVPGLGRIGIFSDAQRAAVRLATHLHLYRTVPVLVEGETGTGKEILARLVHHGAEGADVERPFVTVNCSAITPTLFESELFGYERGAFTGASGSGKQGKLEMAQGGTIFLDEIGDLPLDLQPKFLRVLQQREMYRVGSTKRITLDVRIIGATNRNLTEMVKQGTFRQDLYYRLNVGRIKMPPLRENHEAILPLTQMFLEKFSLRHGRRFRYIPPEARELLLGHSWPGNVRELENAVERLTLLHDGPALRPEFLRFEDGEIEIADSDAANVLRPGRLILPPDRLDLEELEKEIVRKALRMFNGNKSRTAAYLGLSRSALYTRLNRLD